MKKNMTKISAAAVRCIKENKKQYDRDHLTLGIAVRLARTGSFSSLFSKSYLPSKLPKEYSCELSKMTYKSSERMLKKIRENPEILTDEEGWRNPSKRMRAIEDELILFSGCEVIS